jgi:hypothetical protein
MIGDIVQKALDTGHRCKRMVLLMYIYMQAHERGEGEKQ